LGGCDVGTTARRILLEYAVEMALYIKSFMKVGTGLQATLRYCLGNLRDCIVGITDVRDL
jgi:hypothetical protein